LEKAG
jgi:hypothetical protein